MCASTSKSGTRPLQLRKCRAVYSTSATRELAKIAGDLEDAGQSRSAALAFIDELTDYCEPYRPASRPIGTGTP